MSHTLTPTTIPRITQLHVKGLRSLADVQLDIHPLTVLIGKNGSGKSSIVEACELLRRLAQPSFLDEFYAIHGGFSSLLRHGSSNIELGLSAEFDSADENGKSSEKLQYRLILSGLDNGQSPRIREHLDYSCNYGFIDKEQKHKSINLTRVAGTVTCTSADALGQSSKETSTISPRSLLLHDRSFAAATGVSLVLLLHLLQQTLAHIDVHLPFDVKARWSRRAANKPAEMRETAPLAPTHALAPSGTNLANAYHALKNEFSDGHWQETIGYVRLGLGDDIDSVNTRTGGGGGDLGLWLKYKHFDQQISANALADGELSYLAFVALYRLNAHKSLMVFDEPDLHMHPKMILRVLGFFESLGSDGTPVLLTTHSDRLLDGLQDPAKSVVLCECDESRATQLYRPDAEALADWLTEYRGFGAIRSEGYESSVMTEHIKPEATES